MSDIVQVAGSEKKKWDETKVFTEGVTPVTLGPYVSRMVRKTPRRLLNMLSYYKFAAKMIGAGQSILEVGCSEGLGSSVLAEFASSYHGLDFDTDAIQIATESFSSPKVRFTEGDVLKTSFGTYDAVVNLDVIEHIYPENADQFLGVLSQHCNDNGIMIVGTPNITSDQYASPMTKHGHVNLYSGDRLKAAMAPHFRRVVVFSANDEMVHTGFWPMAHYLIGVGFCPIRS